MILHDIIQTEYGYIFLALLFIMLLIKDNHDEHRVITAFRVLLFISLLVVFLDLTEDYFILKRGAAKWCTLNATLKYAVKPSLLWLVLLISERDKPRRTKMILTIPLMIEVILLAVSLPFGWIVYFTDPMNVFHYGPLNPVTWITLLIYMILIIRSAIASRNSRGECFFLLFGEMFILFNIINELLNHSIPGMEHTITILTILIYYLYFSSHSDNERRLEREKELNQARVQAMISQIKPHFIYNSLACIAETCHEGSPQGEEAILTFSSYLRNCFQSLTDDGLIPFSDELASIEYYINLEKMQTPDKFRMIFDIQERSFQVPILSIETLVENAVKHGIRGKHGTGTVALHTFPDERGVVILIQDDGVGFDPKQPIPDDSHLGLRNAQLRLHEQCCASLSVISEPGKGTEIEIVIPRE